MLVISRGVASEWLQDKTEGGLLDLLLAKHGLVITMTSVSPPLPRSLSPLILIWLIVVFETKQVSVVLDASCPLEHSIIVHLS